MTRLGIRLTLAGGREALTRFFATAFAVGIGVGLLLIVLAGFNAVDAQSQRAAWLESSSTTAPTSIAAQHQPLWWIFTTEQYKSETIYRVDVAATGPHSPRPPGVPYIPAAGQYFVSPALASLIRSVPATELGDRFAGHEVGILGPSAVPSPSSLIVLVGHTVAQLSSMPGAQKVTGINSSPPASVGSVAESGASVVSSSAKTEVLLVVGALALLLPVLIFIGTATRLAATRREQRFATMRLIGATPRQVAKLAGVESVLSALGGVVIGFALYFALYPLVEHASFTGQAFASGEFSLNVIDVAIAVLCVPIAALIAGRVALRRVQISPLGVTRRVTPSAPRAYRAIPLVAGIVELALFATFGKPTSVNGQIDAYVAGFVLLMVGLVIAGPWLTMVGARLFVERTGRVDVLLAGRRLTDNPRGAFRSVSGLIIAVFVTTATVGITGTILSEHATSTGVVAKSNTLVDQFGVGNAVGIEGISISSIPTTLVPRLEAIPGVTGVAVLHTVPGYKVPMAISPGEIPALVSCAQLDRAAAFGSCATDADVAVMHPNFGFSLTPGSQKDSRWPASTESTSAIASLPVEAVVVATNDSSVAIEQARTRLLADLPFEGPPTLLGSVTGENAQLFGELARVADLVIVVSLLIASCGLAVSVVGGIADRRRPFSLLRLTGVPLAILRRVIALESAVPLIAIAVVSVGLGLLGSELFLTAQLHSGLRMPGLAYFACIV
ncbi:MAG TPA: ABC transporter permease, partial [Galbitalea sp.]|nr:ABC transporter permease [Galbitalea sp.]